jgi:hypothetical protein
VDEDGRGPSIWDTFARLQKNKVQDGSNGDVVSLGGVSDVLILDM